MSAEQVHWQSWYDSTEPQKRRIQLEAAHVKASRDCRSGEDDKIVNRLPLTHDFHFLWDKNDVKIEPLGGYGPVEEVTCTVQDEEIKEKRQSVRVKVTYTSVDHLEWDKQLWDANKITDGERPQEAIATLWVTDAQKFVDFLDRKSVV